MTRIVRFDAGAPSTTTYSVFTRGVNDTSTASLETPVSAGSSRTGTAASPSTRRTFALSGRETGEPFSKSIVYAMSACASNVIEREVVGRRPRLDGGKLERHAPAYC